MAKKMPLIISTLTLLASSLISTATWADGFNHLIDGPWTFEEMMAAEAEVQPIIEAVCPYESNVTECVDQYTDYRYYDDPIYNRLPIFENNQFHVLSLDPNPKNGKTTIEYYFNSENSYEKNNSPVRVEADGMGNIIRKYFDDSSSVHTISRLYIYQVEAEYTTEASDINSYEEEVFASPHTKVLYSGIKTESESSLLPVNQKGTLEIEEISYDPEYHRWFFVMFEDENGKLHIQRVVFPDCHQGGELCKMQYTKESPTALLVNKPTYEEGYEDGYNDGLAAGYSEGYNSGYDDGENNGYANGFANGTEAGRIEGYNSGYTEGRTNGYIEGQGSGYTEGHTYGYIEGQNSGYTAGRTDGYIEGYNSGYDSGYNDGYAAGQDAAPSSQGDNIDEGNNDATDNQSNNTANTNNTDNTDDTNNADSNQIINQITNDININSGPLTISRPKFSAKTPNTGSGAHQEAYSTEFPWWLGAIFIFGTLTLVWFFAPNRKKSHKKSQKPIDNIL